MASRKRQCRDNNPPSPDEGEAPVAPAPQASGSRMAAEIFDSGVSTNQSAQRMKTWQRYFIWQTCVRLEDYVEKEEKEKFLDELVVNNIISKIEAAFCKYGWPKCRPVPVFSERRGIMGRTSLSLFKALSGRTESHQVLLGILQESGNSKAYEELKEGELLAVQLLHNDSFKKASYKIAFEFDPSTLWDMEKTMLGYEGESLLHVAVGCGHVDMIRKLKSLKSSQDERGNCPHHYLGKWSSNVIQVTGVLQEIGTDLSTKNKEGETLAHAVAANISSPHDFHEWCDYMIKEGMKQLLIEKNIMRENSLHYAIVCFDISKQTLDLFDKDDLNQRDNSASGLVHFAAFCGRTKTTIEDLIKCGVEWNCPDIHGLTVLHLAVWSGNSEAVEYFLKLGADPIAKTETSRTPLHFLQSTVLNFVEITKLFVGDQKVDGKEVAIKLLLEVDNGGNTPAHIWGFAGSKQQYREWTKYLLDSGLVTIGYFFIGNNFTFRPPKPHVHYQAQYELYEEEYSKVTQPTHRSILPSYEGEGW